MTHLNLVPNRSVSFCIHRGKPGSVLKTMMEFRLEQAYSQPANDRRLMEGKLSIGLFSPSSISFNVNAIVRNFYLKKFHSSKLSKVCRQLEGNLQMITFDYRTTLEL